MRKIIQKILFFNIFYFLIVSFAIADPIVYGQTIDGIISTVSEIDSYAFSAQAGDKVLISFRDTSGISAFDPNIVLLNSSGSPIASQNAPSFATLTADISSGDTYTIVISDNGSNSTGNYQITLERLNNPADATVIIYGQSIDGSITNQTEQDVYGFTAQAGDRILIPFVDNSGTTSYELHLSLRTADGIEIATAESGTSGVLNAVILENGTYYIWINEVNYDRLGNYQITLERLNNPADATAIIYGQSIDGSITNQTEHDVYGFAAQAGEGILIPFVDNSGTTSYELHLSLRTADGTEIAIADSGTSGALTATITTSGAYYLWVNEIGYDRIGNYQITLERLNNPADVTTIVYGQSIDSSILSQTEQDAYGFMAQEGDRILIPFVDNSGTTSYELHLSLRTADGIEIATAESGTSGALTATITSSGAYYLWVNEIGYDRIGAYQITLERLNNPVDVTAIAYGQSIDGSITIQTEQDVYSFIAEMGDNISLPFVDNSGTSSYELHLSLRTADGIEIATAESGTSGTLIATVPTSGIYYVWVNEVNYDRLGNYQITLVDNFISNVSFSPKFINSSLGEVSTISYTLNRDAHVVMKIYRAFIDSSGIYQRQLIDTLGPIVSHRGRQAITWTGTDAAGTALAPSAYVFSVEATSIDAQRHSLYDPVYSLGSSTILNGLIDSTNFNPYSGEGLTITYDLSTPSWVQLLVGVSSSTLPIRILTNYEPREMIQNQDYWDGRKDDGTFASTGTYSVRGLVSILPDNSIVVKSPDNLINYIKSNPYAIYPIYGQQTNIDFSITNDANVTIEILSSTGVLIRTIQTNRPEVAGVHTVSWDALDNAGKLVSVAGHYRVRVTATSGAGMSQVKDGNITIIW